MKLHDAAVLFVDDEPFFRESMGGWLEQHVRRALCAEHGKAALAILAANRIDLLLSDVRMPVMDGIALVGKLRGLASSPRVILVTGFSDLTLRQAYEMGVDTIFEKPVDREDLLRIMQNSLSDPAELWRQPSHTEAAMQLSTSFPSLAAALNKPEIAFGRRGFCIKSPSLLYEGPVDLVVTFTADERVLSGQGVVRWVDARKGQAGIEITCLDAACRTWVLDLVKEKAGIEFVPGSLTPRTPRPPASPVPGGAA
jgi:CheY-like chemotaxis protein